MTLDEALADIEKRGRGNAASSPVSQDGITCADMHQAVRLLAEATEHLRKRDPLYGDRRRFRSLAPPPGSVLPG
jgi:hypothetical protein